MRSSFLIGSSSALIASTMQPTMANPLLSPVKKTLTRAAPFAGTTTINYGSGITAVVSADGYTYDMYYNGTHYERVSYSTATQVFSLSGNVSASFTLAQAESTSFAFLGHTVTYVSTTAVTVSGPKANGTSTFSVSANDSNGVPTNGTLTSPLSGIGTDSRTYYRKPISDVPPPCRAPKPCPMYLKPMIHPAQGVGIMAGGAGIIAGIFAIEFASGPLGWAALGCTVIALGCDGYEAALTQ